MSPNDARSSSPSSCRERRTAVRHLACFPAQVQAQAGGLRSALIRDLSTTGTMLLTRARLTAGDQVRLNLDYGSEPHQSFTAMGRVVRVEKWRGDISVWRFSVAVRFSSPATAFEPEIKALAAAQAHFRRRR